MSTSNIALFREIEKFRIAIEIYAGPYASSSVRRELDRVRFRCFPAPRNLPPRKAGWVTGHGFECCNRILFDRCAGTRPLSNRAAVTPPP